MGTPAYGVALIVLGVGRFAEIGALGDVSLTGAGVWCYAFALLVSAWAIWIRPRWPRVRRYDLSVRGLSPALEGFRVVHLSDLHLGNFAPASWGRRWVDRANRLGPDAVAVTGDLVVSGTDFYPDVAEVLSDLRAKHGVFLCLGNHDQWDEPRLVRELEARDLAVLKNATREIEHREGRLVFGGIDDLYTKKGDLERVIGTRSDVPMILLAHYPDVGIESAERGVEVTLSGHTHGGQIGVPFLAKWLNVATLSGQLGADTFVFGSGQLVVSAGLGTTGPPMRLGVPPEIGLVVLHAA